jgi:hypothetical protein
MWAVPHWGWLSFKAHLALPGFWGVMVIPDLASSANSSADG